MVLSKQVCIAWAEACGRDTGHPVVYEDLAYFGEDFAAARFRLANGLGVVLAPDDRAPIFAYQTWFRVGSRDEDPGATGLAHLFEHLMFKGTGRHASGVFDREMERRGAQTNAATWVDWTYYTQALAARGDNLEAVIAFESDRMHNLKLDEATFRSELEVVKNERRLTVEDSVPGQLSEALMADAFTAHPYRWPTIGSMDHLQAMQIPLLAAFYRRFYAPNNATVVVVGDIEGAPLLRDLARAYGPLVAQPSRRQPPTLEPAQAAPRYRAFAASTVAPQMLVGFRAVAQSGEDFPALEMLAEILAGGDTGRLYQKLVSQAALCTEVAANIHPFAEPGLFEVSLTLRPGVQPQAALELMQAEMDALAQGVQDWEVDKARHGLEIALYETLAEVEGCAEMLGHFETTQGDLRLAFGQAQRRAGLGVASLQQAAARTFVPSGRTTVVALPQ